ncbi:MAG: pelota family protein [Candidatus Altiarchaeota archaeon]|nr:pelota family protein [Candidatus Altiarchaeota archaeon]
MRTKLKKGQSEVIPENLDDLWLLSEIIKEGDIVGMRTVRKIKLSLGDRSEAEKKPMFLKISVSALRFEEYSMSLRISGQIVEGPEDIKGTHSFSVSGGSVLNIYKDLGVMEKDLLKEAKTKKPDVVFVILDREDCMIAHGGERFWIKSGLVSKGSDEEADFRPFFGQIKSRLNEITPEYVVVAGPGFTKEKLLPELSSFKTVSEGASSVGESGLKEVMSRGALEKVGVILREAEEYKALESILADVKSGKSFYGLKDTEDLIEKNNVEYILVSSSLISSSVRDKSYARLRELIEKVKYAGGRVMLVGRNKESMKQLDGLGGIAGHKRW